MSRCRQCGQAGHNMRTCDRRESPPPRESHLAARLRLIKFRHALMSATRCPRVGCPRPAWLVIARRDPLSRRWRDVRTCAVHSPEAAAVLASEAKQTPTAPAPEAERQPRQRRPQQPGTRPRDCTEAIA